MKWYRVKVFKYLNTLTLVFYYREKGVELNFMAKRLNSDIQIGMSFVADTTSAQKAIQQLNSQIDSLMTKHSNPTNADFTRGLTEESKKAQAELAKLKVSLEGAVNANTGKLDLSQFHQSLKASGTNLSQLKENLSKFGVAGDKAFANLTRSIISAEAPLRKTNGLLTEFATTLKNTARWQISSSILHGFMGSIQHAYYYAQDLNESLNNIRIVTSNSTDEMAKFAKQANAAAKSLSTTTTQYTDAALIYYQQGLNDKQVKERTDVTMKMANVAGESAQTVSDQMTAVWNNFDDGSQSLEHYADVLTALGAATASSTSEITEGLEKFAATANTVGLSYEYATSALATVTATTRQSADVVGTSFKTLFARIQGLQLGDTLDDGTDLNKYSKALASVGISIKEENGEMKKMDTILDEMGAKWGTLAKDQQIALAETVAGVRQYTQMIALMDNWDFFKQNLETANNSTGALQDQADIYAESWEAASKRVKAAAETIYSDLLNDDFFISLTDGLAKVLEGVDGLIKGLGGVPGILTLTGTIATKVFQQQIAGGIKNLGDGLKSFFGGTKDSAMGLKKEANDLMKDNPMGGSMVSESAKNTMNAAYKSQIEVQDMVIEKTKNLSTEQQKVVQQLQKQHQLSVDIAVETAEAAEAAEKEARAAARRVKASDEKNRDLVTSKLKGVKRAGYFSELAQNTQWHNQSEDGDVKKAQEQALAKLNAIDTSKLTRAGRDKINKVIEKLQGTMTSVREVDIEFENLCAEAEKMANDITEDAQRSIGDFDNAEKAIETARNSGEKESENDRAGSVMENSGDAVKGVIKDYNEQPMSFGDKFAAATQGAVAFAGALTSLSTTVKTLGDNSASSGEKVEALVMGLSSMAMQLSIVPWETVGAGLAKIGTSAAAAVPALGGLTTALGATATGLIAVTGLLGAAVAVGAFLAWAYQAHKFGSTAEGALEKAQNGVKAMREEVEKTTERVESLRSSFDEYQTVVSELDKCKKGTEEWNDALQKVNSTVMDLMANPNLASIQGLFKNEDGHLAIDEDVYQQAIQKAEQAQINSKSVLAFAELDKQKAQNRVNLEGLADLSDKNRSRGMYEETEMSSASNTLSLDYLARQLANGVVLSDEAEASIKAWADANGETVQEIKNQLTTTAESIKTEALARDNLIKAKISELAKGTEYEDDSKAQEEMAESFTSYLDSEIEKLDKDLNDRETDENEKQLLALYNQAIGANYQSAEYKGIKENRRVVFTDEDGNEGQEIPIHEILAAIAQANTSLSSIDSYIKEIPDKVEGLKKEKGLSKDQKSNLDNLKHILKEGNMDNLSTEEFKKVGEGTVNWENPKYNEIATAFQQEYGMSLQKAADELGTSAKALSEKIISSHEKTEANIKSLNLDDPKALYGLSTKGKSVETLTSEKNALDNAFKTLGQAGLDSLKGIIKEIPLEAQNALTEDGFDWNSIDSIDDLEKALASVNVTITDGLLDSMQAYTDKLKEHKKILDDFNIDESRDKARSGRKAYEEVTTSKDNSISEDSYNKLTPEMQEFFAATEDGTYKLISSAEEFLKVVTSIEGSYEKTLDRNQEVVNRIEQFSSYGGNINTDLTHDAYNEETGKVDKDYLRQQIAAVALTNKTVSSDQIDKFKEDVNTKSDKELAETSKQILNLLQGKDGLDGSSSLKEFKDTKQEEITNAEMKDAFLAKNGAELDDKLKNGDIGKDAYNNALTSMNNTTDADLDSGKVQEYGKAISEAAEESDEFADSLKNDEEAAEDVAESLMRYDDAVKDVSEGYDKWKSAIEDIDETGGVLDPEVVNGLSDAYGDMFDMDASQLSNEFLTSAENLDLLKQAAEGSAEAYDELQTRAQNDILIHTNLSEEDLATVQDKISSFVNDADFQDLEVGADIDDTNLLNKLTEIVNAAGLTASEAQQLLTSMGVDAEVVQETEPETTTVPTYTYKPEKSGSITIDDGDSKREIWGYNYIPQTDVKTIKSGKTVTSLKVTSGHKTAGGGIKAKRAPAPPASKGGGGGGKKGGGGGSAPSTVKKTKTNIDRYWDINNAISKTSHEMEKLAKAKEKMSGTELIDALTKENKLLEQQKKNYQALLKEQQKELSEVIGKIKKKGGSFSGNKLKNYKSLMKKAGQKLHKKENAYNKWTKSKEAKKKEGKAKGKKKLNGVKKAQEEYAELEKLVSRYQQLQYDAIEETKAKMEELLVQEIENNFEKFEIKIKVKADMQDLKKDLNDIQTLFKTDFTKAADDATNWATKMNGAVKNFSTLFSGKTMEQNRKEAQDKLDKHNVKARADQILATTHENNKKALQTKADKDYESAKKSKAKKLVKGLGKKQKKKLFKKFGGKKKYYDKIDKGDKKAINAAFKADFDKKENARIKKLEKKLKKKDLKKLKKVKGKSGKAKIKKIYKKKKFKDVDKTSWAKKKKKKITKKLNKDIAADKKKLGVKGLKVKEVTDPLGKLVQNFGSNSALTSLYDQFTKLNAEKDHFMNGGKKDKTFISTSLSDATEKLRENGKQILDELQKVYNQAKETWDTYLQGVEGVIAEQDKIRSQLDDLYSSLENRGSIAELLWDTNSSAYLNKNEGLIKQQMQIKAQEVQDLNDMNVYYQGQMDAILKKNGGTIYDEDYLKYQEKVRANNKLIESDTIERIKLEQSLQQNSINKALNNLDNSIWGKSFEDVKQDWEETLAFQDKYLSKAQATYKIQSLSNTIQKDIDNTKDLKIQQKLNDFREEEIAHLREKNKLEKDNRALTQDDVDLAQARYDILLKEIALENAKNNKNSMKVVRNQEGNWSYQYVADNGDVEDKQQQLLDSWAAYNEKADEAYKNATQLAMDEYQTHRDKLAKMAQDRKYYNEQGKFETTKFNDDMKAENDKYMAHIKTAFDNSAAHQKEVTYSTVGTLAQAYELDKENVESYTAKEEQAVVGFGNAGVSAYGGISKELTRVFGPGEDGETAIKDFNKDVIPSLETTAAATAKEAGSKWGTATDTAESKTFCGYFNTAMEACKKSAKTYFGEGEDGNKGVKGILDDANQSVDDLTGGIGDLNGAIAGIDHKKLDEFKDGLDKARDSAHEAKSAIGEIAGVIDSVAEELKKVAEEVKAVGDATKKKPKKYSKKWYKSEIKTYKGFKNAKTNEAKVDYLKGLYKDKKNDKKYQGWLKEQKALKKKMNRTKAEKKRLKKLNKNIKHRKNYLKAIDELKKKYAGKIEGASKPVIEGGTDNQTNDTWDAPASTEEDDSDDDDTQTGTDAETIQDGVAAGLSSVLPNDFAQNVMKNTADAIQQQQALLDKTDENTPKIAENTANLANVTSEVKGTINDIQRSIAEDIKTTLSDILTSEKDFISKFDLMSKNLENKEFNNIYNINADFPNAKDVDTIKQAILSLPNLVSQKNNSKTKKKK